MASPATGQGLVFASVEKLIFDGHVHRDTAQTSLTHLSAHLDHVWTTTTTTNAPTKKRNATQPQQKNTYMHPITTETCNMHPITTESTDVVHDGA